MDLNEIQIFVKVVQAGSFSGAARQLGLPNSTVSAKVSALEGRLGITLLQRTTRKLSITDAGQAFYERCASGLEEILAAESALSAGQGEPQGTLRLTAPVELGQSILPPVVDAYQKRFPKMKVEILFSDRNVDLVGEGIDLAIRAGALNDSSFVAKKLGAGYFAPFSTRDYLTRRGAPAHPRELAQHRILHFAPLGQEEWNLLGPRGKVSVSIDPCFITNDLTMLKALVLSGGGIALLPTFSCYAEVKDKQLVRVLPEWKTNTQPVHFVYPAQKFLPAKLSAFMSMAADPLRASLQSFEL